MAKIRLEATTTITQQSADRFPFSPSFRSSRGTGYRSYDSATLVSSKQLTCFSDFRMPLGSPDHLTLESYVQYLEDYVSHFKLDKEVDFRLSTKVIKIERGGEKEGGHWVTSQRNSSELERSEHFTHLSICSGLHVTPAVFEIPGLPSPLTTKEEVNERAAAIEEEKKSRTSTSSPSILSLHSCAYSSPSIFKDKSVLILGTGETGMDLSFFSVKGLAKQITLSTRSGFLSFPAVLSDFRVFGVDFDGSLPIDGLITNLFETAYVHPWVAKSHLRWFVSDAVIKKVLWFLTGTEAGCNQWVGELPEEKLGRAYVFLNKSAKVSCEKEKTIHFLSISDIYFRTLSPQKPRLCHTSTRNGRTDPSWQKNWRHISIHRVSPTTSLPWTWLLSPLTSQRMVKSSSSRTEERKTSQ